jgi:hypothetical protein
MIGDDDIVEIARSWIEFMNRLNPNGGDLSREDYQKMTSDEDWPVDLLLNQVVMDPEVAMTIIEEIVSLSDDDWIMESVGSGPIESLLKNNADIVRSRLDRGASASALKPALRHVWINGLDGDVQEFVKNILDS